MGRVVDYKVTIQLILPFFRLKYEILDPSYNIKSFFLSVAKYLVDRWTDIFSFFAFTVEPHIGIEMVLGYLFFLEIRLAMILSYFYALTLDVRGAADSDPIKV